MKQRILNGIKDGIFQLAIMVLTVTLIKMFPEWSGVLAVLGMVFIGHVANKLKKYLWPF